MGYGIFSLVCFRGFWIDVAERGVAIAAATAGARAGDSGHLSGGQRGRVSPELFAQPDRPVQRCAAGLLRRRGAGFGALPWRCRRSEGSEAGAGQESSCLAFEPAY